MTNRRKLHVVLDSVVAVSAFLTDGLAKEPQRPPLTLKFQSKRFRNLLSKPFKTQSLPIFTTFLKPTLFQILL